MFQKILKDIRRSEFYIRDLYFPIAQNILLFFGKFYKSVTSSKIHIVENLSIVL